ncbi:hypothetical protein MASR1M12_07250 [Erysipelotrichia bacterium]
MKHFLNFKPTVVYRKGSSFMLKTSLVILFSVPLALTMFFAYKYTAAGNTTAFYQSAEEQLNARLGSFKEELAKLRPAKEDLEEAEGRYFAWRRASTLCRTSWSTLLNRLEKLTPPQVRYRRIGIRPEKLVRISLEGEATDLGKVTELLRALFAESVFVNPNLKRHANSELEGNTSVTFSLEVDYAGESGELP